MVESYVVVGQTAEAEEAARYWRFVPIGVTDLLDEPDQREIQRTAEQRLSLEDVYRTWVVSEDPREQLAALRAQFAAGVTDVFTHSGQSDRRRVIDFYARHVLPALRTSSRAA